MPKYAEIDGIQTKLCPRCSRYLPFTDFYRSRASGDGVNAYCKVCTKENTRRWQQTNAERFAFLGRRWRLANIYGLTEDQYLEMATDQLRQCGICDRRVERLVVDHDHVTGVVRGLLCDECNRGLGCFRDNMNALLAAAKWVSPYE